MATSAEGQTWTNKTYPVRNQHVTMLTAEDKMNLQAWINF